ncbi:MAG TPA: hypothetical protein VNH18_34925, partial [Bryobacteraceae bacterium]|nr:hypothetical protein [Bryobacteraceae bacterium]
ASLVDVVERFYRGPAAVFAQVPPPGMITKGDEGTTSPAFTEPFNKKKADGSPLYVNKVNRTMETGDPSTLIRNYLQAQYEKASYFVLSGRATNLAAALNFKGTKELIETRSTHLVIAGCDSFAADLPAARKLLAEWPNPVIYCPEEIGKAIPFPASALDKEFPANNPDHPVAEAYKAFHAMPYDAPTTAMAAALYATRQKETYFKVSEPGTLSISTDGKVSFTASPQGKHQQLSLDPAQKDKVLAAYVELASAKVVLPQRFRPAAAAADPGKVPPKEPENQP